MSGLNPSFIFAGEVTDDTPGAQSADVVLHVLTRGAYVPVAKFNALGLCLMKDGAWIQISLEGVLVVDEPIITHHLPPVSGTCETPDGLEEPV